MMTTKQKQEYKKDVTRKTVLWTVIALTVFGILAYCLIKAYPTQDSSSTQYATVYQKYSETYTQAVDTVNGTDPAKLDDRKTIVYYRLHDLISQQKPQPDNRTDANVMENLTEQIRALRRQLLS